MRAATEHERPLSDRHAVVTGATRGIGAAVAEALAREGASLTLMGRDARTLAPRAEALAARHGTRAHAVACDVADADAVARAFGVAGVDLIHVSAGQTSPLAKPVYGRLFQTPLSDRIRNEAGVPTIAVGNVTEWDQVNAILAAGRADLVALARPHLADPQWTLHAAAAQGYGGQWWPVQYLSGRRQLERARERELELRGTAAI